MWGGLGLSTLYFLGFVLVRADEAKEGVKNERIGFSLCVTFIERIIKVGNDSPDIWPPTWPTCQRSLRVARLCDKAGNLVATSTRHYYEFIYLSRRLPVWEHLETCI